MRHRLRGRQLSVDSEHRLAIRRNLAQSLFIHGKVTTTAVKAKEVRPFAEKLITLARKERRADQGEKRADAVAFRRQIIALLGWHRTPLGTRRIRKRYGDEPLTEHDGVIRKLCSEIAEQFENRDGGYIRILKLAKRRQGDGGEMAIMQLVPAGADAPSAAPTGRKRSRHRRAEGLESLRKKREQRKTSEAARTAQRAASKAEAEAKAQTDAPAPDASTAPSSETKPADTQNLTN